MSAGGSEHAVTQRLGVLARQTRAIQRSCRHMPWELCFGPLCRLCAHFSLVYGTAVVSIPDTGRRVRTRLDALRGP